MATLAAVGRRPSPGEQHRDARRRARPGAGGVCRPTRRCRRQAAPGRPCATRRSGTRPAGLDTITWATVAPSTGSVAAPTRAPTAGRAQRSPRRVRSARTRSAPRWCDLVRASWPRGALRRPASAPTNHGISIRIEPLGHVRAHLRSALAGDQRGQQGWGRRSRGWPRPRTARCWVLQQEPQPGHLPGAVAISCTRRQARSSDRRMSDRGMNDGRISPCSSGWDRTRA